MKEAPKHLGDQREVLLDQGLGVLCASEDLIQEFLIDSEGLWE
jgi:hypothetical protein